MPRPTSAATGAPHDESGVDLQRGAWLSHLMLFVRLTSYGAVDFRANRNTSRDAEEPVDFTRDQGRFKGVD